MKKMAGTIDEEYDLRLESPFLKKEMDGLSLKGGYEVAWDNGTNAELIPDHVKQARQVETSYSPTMPREPSRNNIWARSSASGGST